MSTERKGAEMLVGLFLLIGFGVVAVMVILFGRVGHGMQHFYTLDVEFPNAGGLTKGSDVLLAGARIGMVDEAPALDAGSYRVTARLQIRTEVKIPSAARFLIGSSGLMGDKFVDVQLPPTFAAGDVLQPNQKVEGKRSGGLGDLTDKGSEVMDRLVVELEHIEALTVRLNEGLLHERNLKNIEQTFENLRETTERFKEASQDLDSVVKKSGDLVDATRGTVQTADSAAADLKVTIGELRKMIAQATKAVDTTASLMRRASEGDGALGTLITDKKMAEDLRALVANLRHSGVLFYKDRPPPAAAPAASRR